MKYRTLLFLTLIALLATACSAQVATPTPRPADAAATPAAETVAEATVASAEPITTTETITTTSPLTPTGGVEVALAAIDRIDGALATVNGEAITWAEYEPELLQSLYTVTASYGVDWNQAENMGMLPDFLDQILQTLVQRTLLRQLAPEAGIVLAEAELQAYVDEQKQTILAGSQYASWDEFKESTGLSDEYFARLMEDNLLVEKITETLAPEREVEQVHARHILVADEETAKKVLERLAAGEDFAALATELSQDTGSKESGGDLGWFPKGVMVAEFEQAAFSLEAGATSEPVKSDYGYHIIEVLEKGLHELDEQTYDSLKDKAFSTWLEEAQAAADIEIPVKFASEE